MRFTRPKTRIALHWGLSIVFFTVYGVVSVLRQLTMRSGAGLDLGIFEQAIRGYAQLRAPVSDIKGPGFNLLGDHFSPILVLLAPAYRLFPTPVTLLVAQAALFALSVAPVTRLAVERLGRPAGTRIGLAYGLSWGVLQAVFFDFHEIAFAVPLLAFSMAALARQRYRVAVGWALPLLLVKEDQATLVVAIGVYIFCRGRRVLGGLTALGGVAAGLLTVLVVIPWFNPRHLYSYFDMAGHPAADPVTRLLLPWWKLDTVAAILATVVFLAFRSPLSAIVLAVLVPRFWLTNPNLWGMHYHYTATQMPILFVAFVDAVCRLRVCPSERVRRLARFAPAAVLVVALAFTPTVEPLRDLLVHPSHLLVDQQTRAALALLQRVPDGASIAARDRYIPWLTGRCQVYRYPDYPRPSLRPQWLVLYEEDHAPDTGYALVGRAAGLRMYRDAGDPGVHAADG